MRGRALALATILSVQATAGMVVSRVQAEEAPEPHKTPNQKAAEKHYKRARELYQLGRYREAIAQLEAALRLDPRGAELLYNLGLVHEKLGEADEAIDAYKRYLAVLGPDADPEETAKVKGIIKRLEGAKVELKKREANRTEHRFTPFSQALLVGAGVSAVATIVLGAYALGHDRQARDYVIRDGRGFEERQALVDRAHSEATLANVFGALTIVGAGVGLTLYFTSEYQKQDNPNETPPPAPSSALRFRPVARGAAMSFEVTF